MPELLRNPAFQKSIAILAALVSFYYTYLLVAEAVIDKAIRENSHDGQIGLGAGAAGLMAALPAAFIAYRFSMRLLQGWEKRYMRRLDERDRRKAAETSRTYESL
jgi:hypothetical protein